jgi:hypothetical protein
LSGVEEEHIIIGLGLSILLMGLVVLHFKNGSLGSLFCFSGPSN